MKFAITAQTILGAALMAAWGASAPQVDWQVGWDACPAPTADDFTAEAIVTRAKDNAHSPLKIDFHVVEDAAAPNGFWTNFYFSELHSGKIRYYQEKSNSVVDVGTVVDGEFGGKDMFSGLTLDPDFNDNRWVYTHYCGSGKFIAARYTINEDNTLDQASMKTILEVPMKNGNWHGESNIDFDAYGDLWLGYGDNGTHNNEDGNYGLSTADARASVLRIHPEDDGSYTIPSKATGDPTGNMGEYWSEKFSQMGEADLATQYADKSKVLPEIYVAGVRNPYTLKVVHARNRWVAFGDVGPDRGKISEEFHLLQEPGYAGWNIWAGEVAHHTPSGADINIEGITRISESSARGGATGLPPVIRSQYDVHQASGMSGPIYWYNGKVNSKRKFPAYYHGKWFVADNDEDAWDGPPWVRVLTMNEDYTATASAEDFFEFTKERIQDMWFGPDGALYIAYFYKGWFSDNEENEIWRFSYKGTNPACLPTELVPPPGAVLPPAGFVPDGYTSIANPEASLPGIHFTALGEFQVSDWTGEVRLFDVQGNEVPLRHDGNGVFRLQDPTPTAGVYFLKAGAEVVKVSNIRAD